MLQNRFTSRVTWVAVGAQVVGLLIILGVIDVGLGDKINGVIVAILELLTAFGIVNNPTDRENF